MTQERDTDFFDPLGLEDDIDTNDGFALAGTVLYTLYCAILFVILIYNGIQVYGDLEKSIKPTHVRRLIEKSASYAIIVLFTETSVFLYFVAIVLMLPTYVVDTYRKCDVVETMSGSFYQLGKMVMYFVFIARIFYLYKGSKFAMRSHVTIVICIFLGLYNLAVISVMVGLWGSNVYLYSDGPSFPNYCQSTLEPISVTLMTLEDLVVSGGLLYSFWHKLNGTFSLLNKGKYDDVSKDGRVIKRIKYSGYKVTVLTTVSIVSSLTLLIGTLLTGITWVVGFDTVVNALCMIMMNPHYDDKKWYGRCCFLCILCCDKSGYRTESNDVEKTMKKNIQSGQEIQESLLLSGNTFDQLRLTGQQLEREYTVTDQPEAIPEEAASNVEMKQQEQEPEPEPEPEPDAQTDPVDLQHVE